MKGKIYITYTNGTSKTEVYGNYFKALEEQRKILNDKSRWKISAH